MNLISVEFLCVVQSKNPKIWKFKKFTWLDLRLQKEIIQKCTTTKCIQCNIARKIVIYIG